MSFSSGPKPYVVKYKGNRDGKIKPGEAGRFPTREEAEACVMRTREQFDMNFGGPNAAKVGILEDPKAMAKMRELEGIDDGLGDADTILESGYQEWSLTIRECLEDEHGYTKEEAETLCVKHAKLIMRKISGAVSPRLGKEIAALIQKREESGETEATPDPEKEELRKKVETLEAQLRDVSGTKSKYVAKAKKQLDAGAVNEPEEAGMPE